MKLLLENWRKYLTEEEEGEGMLLYHATCFPPESFAKGIDVRRAKGYGQGEGFYFWTSLKQAIDHGSDHILSGKQKEVPCPDNPPIVYIVVSDEPVTPETFDIDYEVYVEGFAAFMIDNLQYFFKNMEVFGMAARRERSLINPPHQFQVPADKSGTIRLQYLASGTGTDTHKATSLSKIANKLAEIDPGMFQQFEKQFLSQASAIKYNGEKVIYPLRIEDLEGNVVWSR